VAALYPTGPGIMPLCAHRSYPALRADLHALAGPPAAHRCVAPAPGRCRVGVQAPRPRANPQRDIKGRDQRGEVVDPGLQFRRVVDLLRVRRGWCAPDYLGHGRVPTSPQARTWSATATSGRSTARCQRTGWTTSTSWPLALAVQTASATSGLGPKSAGLPGATRRAILATVAPLPDERACGRDAPQQLLGHL